MQRSDFRSASRLRVRWAEVDMQKIVFNGHYLLYFDTGMADYWRAVGLPYADAMVLLGGDVYARKATVEYHASAHYEETLDVCVRCARIGTSSMAFDCAIFYGDKLLITGELLYVFADPATQTSRPVPQPLREVFEAFERGEDVLQIVLGDWATLGAEAGPLRTAVFIEEQGIPAEMEWDEDDATCVHAVVRNRLGQTVGTGRLLSHGPGVMKIGRMAVHRAMRGSQVGRRLLQALMEAARERGASEVLLHAQRSAVGFYARNGFATRGEPFDEAGIPHVAMACAL
ncbi:MAG: YbgC/FadM family acyl-CoA thioesterase [Burkholderiales bacterium]